MPDLLPIQKRMPLFEDIFRAPQPAAAPTPTPSLFAPEDIAAGRRAAVGGFGAALLENSGWGRPVGSVGTGQALGAAFRAGNEGYRSGVQNAANERMALGAQARRQQIMAQYPELPGETSDQTIRRLEKIFAALIQSGDTEGAGKIGEVLKSYGGGNRAGKTPELVDFGGFKQAVDPNTGIPFGPKYPKTPNPRDPNAPDTAALLREQRMFDRANRLMDDYRSETKLLAQAANQVRTLYAAAPAALAGDARAQIGLVFAFMKSLDPNSVVRESEYATAANAAGVPDRVRNQYNKLLDGGFLTKEQVTSFLQRGRDAAAGWKREQDALIEDYTRRAKRWNIDPQDVTRDYFRSVGELPVSGASAAGRPDDPFAPLNGLFPPNIGPTGPTGRPY